MAIKAHLDQPAGGIGRRTGPRIAQRRALRLETSGFVAGRGTNGANVTIHNISAAGLLIETGLDLAEGEQLALDLPQAGAVTAVVVWRSERLFGCAFADALGPAAMAAVQLLAPPSAFAPAARLAAPQTRPGETLGGRLNRLRREAGMTLADVAAALAVSKPTVWAWEKGKARPLPERLDAIAAALGVAPETLLPTLEPVGEIGAVIEECRTRIAEASGAGRNAVRIMIEL